jgi:hypothetical protein
MMAQNSARMHYQRNETEAPAMRLPRVRVTVRGVMAVD